MEAAEGLVRELFITKDRSEASVLLHERVRELILEYVRKSEGGAEVRRLEGDG